MVTKVRERLAVNRQRSHRLRMERFNLRTLNEIEGKGQHCVEISDRFVVVGNLDAKVDIIRAGEILGENIKVSAKDSLVYCE
jgi:hypothetical protein